MIFFPLFLTAQTYLKLKLTRGSKAGENSEGEEEREIIKQTKEVFREWWMERILEKDSKLQIVTWQLWFSVECAVCCSLYSLYNEPRLAPLIPCCPSACVLQNIVPIQRHSFIHTLTYKSTRTHIHVYIHSFWANKCRGSLSLRRWLSKRRERAASEIRAIC